MYMYMYMYASAHTAELAIFLADQSKVNSGLFGDFRVSYTRLFSILLENICVHVFATF